MSRRRNHRLSLGESGKILLAFKLGGLGGSAGDQSERIDDHFEMKRATNHTAILECNFEANFEL